MKNAGRRKVDRPGGDLMGSGHVNPPFTDAGLAVPQQADNVLALFCARVDSNPSSPAVSWNDTDISYRELDRLSSQVANALIANGAVTGAIVAIFLTDRIRQIAATLGCMKAGCVFVSWMRPIRRSDCVTCSKPPGRGG